MILTGTEFNQRLVKLSDNYVFYLLRIYFHISEEIATEIIRLYNNKPNFIFIDQMDFVNTTALFPEDFEQLIVVNTLPELIESLGFIEEYIFIQGIEQTNEATFVFRYFRGCNINCPPLRLLLLDEIIKNNT